MFIALLMGDELEPAGGKDSASENRGKSRKKKMKGKGMQEIGQRAVGKWMVRTWSLHTNQRLWAKTCKEEMKC